MLVRLIDGARLRAEAISPRMDDFRETSAALPPARDIAAALRAPGLSVIAEVKRRSPSAGAIAPDLDPASLAAAYAAGGAAALSVLTEPDLFGALPGDLEAARSHVSLPVLRKDFIVDPVQVWEARAMGADAVLLITGVLDDGTLRQLLDEAAAGGLGALVEAHTADEVRRSVAAGASIVGVNSRDLGTFTVDLTTAERLRPLIPAGVVAVAESGVISPEAARRMRASGYDAVLVGEAAARADDPASFITSLLEAP
jgi:indole-3-glycerol phosphate synthase